MKRFLLFTCDEYYPSGGWNDFVRDSDFADALEVEGRESVQEFWHVVDTQEMQIIRRGKKGTT